MADAALHRLWADVRLDFDRARAMLPSPLAELQGSESRLVEWLDHNELELALDEFEAIGTDNDSPSAYWEHLLSAAERMGLTKHAARLITKCKLGTPSDKGV
jgi:hypothetical protein